jgi:hypothetical protein
MRLGAICLLVATASLWAEAVVIKPKLRLGDELAFQVKRGRDGRASTTSRVRAKVVSADQNGSVLEWVYTDSKIEDPAQAGNPVMQAALKGAADVRMEVMLTPDGEFSGIRNVAEISKKLQSMLAIITGEFTKSISDEAERKRFVESVRQVLTPQMLVSSSSRDIALVFALSGVELEKDEAIEAPIGTPNPFGGGGNLPSNVKIELLDSDGKAAKVQMVQTYDAKELRRLMLPMLMRMSQGKLKESDMPEIQMTDATEFTVNLSDGIPSRISYTRKMAGPAGRVDTAEITRLR